MPSDEDNVARRIALSRLATEMRVSVDQVDDTELDLLLARFDKDINDVMSGTSATQCEVDVEDEPELRVIESLLSRMMRLTLAERQAASLVYASFAPSELVGVEGLQKLLVGLQAHVLSPRALTRILEESATGDAEPTSPRPMTERDGWRTVRTVAKAAASVLTSSRRRKSTASGPLLSSRLDSSRMNSARLSARGQSLSATQPSLAPLTKLVHVEEKSTFISLPLFWACLERCKRRQLDDVIRNNSAYMESMFEGALSEMLLEQDPAAAAAPTDHPVSPRASTTEGAVDDFLQRVFGVRLFQSDSATLAPHSVTTSSVVFSATSHAFFGAVDDDDDEGGKPVDAARIASQLKRRTGAPPLGDIRLRTAAGAGSHTVALSSALNTQSASFSGSILPPLSFIDHSTRSASNPVSRSPGSLRLTSLSPTEGSPLPTSRQSARQQSLMHFSPELKGAAPLLERSLTHDFSNVEEADQHNNSCVSRDASCTGGGQSRGSTAASSPRSLAALRRESVVRKAQYKQRLAHMTETLLQQKISKAFPKPVSVPRPSSSASSRLATSLSNRTETLSDDQLVTLKCLLLGSLALKPELYSTHGNENIYTLGQRRIEAMNSNKTPQAQSNSTKHIGTTRPSRPSSRTAPLRCSSAGIQGPKIAMEIRSRAVRELEKLSLSLQELRREK